MSQKAKSLRIGYQAPNFKAQSTEGPIDLHTWIGNQWAILFAHPAHNSVSTTELAYFQYLVKEFDNRNVKLIAVAPGTVDEHKTWSAEIAKLATRPITIPIVQDPEKSIAVLYDMIDPSEKAKETVNTVRDIFIVDPNKKVRLIFSYPANVGASAEEVIRVIDALQTPDNVAVPAGWQPGQQVLVNPEATPAQVEDVKNLVQNVTLATMTEA